MVAVNAIFCTSAGTLEVDLTKTNPGLKEICVGLGWDVNKYDGGSSFHSELILSYLHYLSL